MSAVHGEGRLWVVATPIGNLADLSPRAREVLAAADLVVCEDTRRTGRLLRRLGIRRPLRSLHAHNEARRLPELLERLAAGERLALVSDAGTPLIQDPGFELVRAAIAAGIPVEPIPGPSALLAALVASGLPPVPFAFFGFPPPRQAARARFVARVLAWPDTAVLYLSPHRDAATVDELAAAAPKRPAVLARELTKRHEAYLRGSLAELAARLRTDPPKGEWTLVIGPRATEEEDEAAPRWRAALTEAEALMVERGARAAAETVAGRYGLPWRRLYRRLLEAQRSEE